MQENERKVLAAAMAVSNIGFGFPEQNEIAQLLQRGSNSLHDAVLHFAQQYCESDEHFEMFFDEARGWEKRIQKRHDQSLPFEWPDKMEIFLAAKKQAAGSGN